MPEPTGFHLFSSVDFLIKRKELLLLVFVCSFVVSWLGIFFLIEDQFEATALLIPRAEDATSVASGLLKSVKSLPLGLGNKSPRSDMDLYSTVIYSRSMMESVIRKFDLLKVYDLDSTRLDHMEKAVKRLRKEVLTKETEESAFQVTVRGVTREAAADMTNFIVRTMNERIVELNVSRSRENREFLGKRVEEIRSDLRSAEDSLRAFQERTGFLDAKTQVQGILTAHTSLETELAMKRFQEGILERMYDKESPQVKEAELQIDVYNKKLAQLRAQGNPGSPLLPLNQLPQTTVEFLRRYRQVELGNLMLEYVLPLYEQAKFEELKDYPILQIIDDAIPPAKKSYPPRTIFALIGAASVTLLVILGLKMRDASSRSPDSRWHALLRDARRWNWRAGSPS